MWKYIVTWTILVAAECPDYVQDEFGNWPISHCSVYHQEAIPMSKEFTDRKLAIEFFDRGNTAMPNEMSIDSVWVVESEYIKIEYKPLKN